MYTCTYIPYRRYVQTDPTWPPPSRPQATPRAAASMLLRKVVWLWAVFTASATSGSVWFNSEPFLMQSSAFFLIAINESNADWAWLTVKVGNFVVSFCLSSDSSKQVADASLLKIFVASPLSFPAFALAALSSFSLSFFSCSSLSFFSFTFFSFLLGLPFALSLPS